MSQGIGKRRIDKRKAFGVGINDSEEPVALVGEKRCKFYVVWRGMLARAYSAAVHKLQPTYTNVAVCTDWLTFSNFKSWMELQDWEGKELDKDIISPGNKTYGPENCCFVTKAVNCFVTDCHAARGEWPLGVTREGNKYRARIRQTRNGSNHLGYYSTPEEAHLAWAIAKRAKLSDLIESEQLSPRVANALIAKYDDLVEKAIKGCDGTQH